jgi:ankyrin repeat protein
MKKTILIGCLLLAAAIHVNAQEIFEAVKANDLGKVKALLEKDASLLRVKDSNGSTPLHSASMTGAVAVAEILVSMGADINAQDGRGYTSLHYACQFNAEPIAVLLIEKGASIDLKENRGMSPLSLAARSGNLRVVKLLVEKGADVNPAPAGGWVTPLSWAAENGYQSVVDFLLANGAQADVKNNWLVRFSVTKGLAKLFEALRTKGATFDPRNSNGGNILHLAAEGGSVDIMKFFMREKEGEMNKPDRYGWTPLHYAASNDRKEAVSFLLGNGANVNASDLSGKMPCHIAAARGNQELATILKGGQGKDQRQGFPVLKGDYLGQKAPGTTPEVFALGIVSTVEIEHGNITISPDGSEIFWTSSYKAPLPYGPSGSFKVWSSKRQGNQWSAPQLSSLTKNELTTDDAPFISPDGNNIIFMSRRAASPGGKDEMKENYWSAERTKAGWGEPRLLDAAINDFQVRWQISISKSGSLYYGAVRPDGKGGSDLYWSKFTDGKYSKPENLGESLNSPAEEGTPFIAPDESYIVFSRESRTDRSLKSGLYAAYKKNDGTWTTPVYLGDEINQGGASAPYVSPDGKYLFFNSGRNGNYDMYWVSAKIIEELRPQAGPQAEPSSSSVPAQETIRVPTGKNSRSFCQNFLAEP